MNYGELKADFTSILNRRDITPSQITSFIDKGIRRIQRSLRIPAMEKLVQHTSDGSGVIPIPNDYLEIVSMATADTADHTKLIRSDLQTVLDYGINTDYARYYYRSTDRWFLAPKPALGQVINIVYYQDFSTLSDPTDTNWLTDAAPDLVVYSALGFSSDFYLDERRKMFKDTYDELFSELMEQGNRDELENASISGRPIDTTENWS